jgi:hypothetical protein
MDVDFNTIFNRETQVKKLKDFLIDNQVKKNEKIQKKGVYIYGAPGSGKSMFVELLLEEMGYDIVKYDAGDIRNKNIIENITHHTMSDKNVLSMFYSKIKPIAIVMDEIDGMNNGDKGGINSLIKLLRPKKTKKQKLEDTTHNPIICISNYHLDKKIKELMNVCIPIELKPPTDKQMNALICKTMPKLDHEIVNSITLYLHGDLRKYNAVKNIYKEYKSILNENVIRNIFIPKSHNEDAKQITKRLLNTNMKLDEHLVTINDTDRTIVGLLWHENIVECLEKIPYKNAFPFYESVLKKLCIADYIDRITFQNQIWQFNEMSSLIKTFNTNKQYHESFLKCPHYNQEVRFTKVLTKYSTEYNNSIFVQTMCHSIGLDKKDTFSFFLELKKKHSEEEIYKILETYDICKLDIKRIYRYLDKYTKQNIIEDNEEL